MNRIQISIFPRPTVQKHIEKESFTKKVIILKKHALKESLNTVISV